MISGIFLTLIPILFVALVVRKLTDGAAKSQVSSPIRSFFQFGLLFVLLIVVGSGIAGLLGRFISTANLVVADQSGLALNLSFIVVGGPILFGIAAWTRKSIQAEPQLTKEPLAAFFMTLASVFVLISALSSWVASIQSLISGSDFDGQSLANAIVWTAVAVGLWLLAARNIPADHLRIHYFVGSLIGFITSVIGLIGVVAATISQVSGMNQADMVSAGGQQISDSLVIAVFGVFVWIQYWIRTARVTKRDNLWLGYVLLIGVGSGLVMAVVAASTTLYKASVWLVGEPASVSAIAHFAGTPTAIGTIIIGLISVWYHTSQLPDSQERTEVNRIYDYLIAGIGLVASAVGLSMILIAILEGLISSTSIVGKSAVNTFLAAGTLVLVGAPVWLHFWRSIQSKAKSAPTVELASPTRRIYLLVLFGVSGIAAIISLLVVAFQLFNDLIASELSTETIRDMRFALGVLLSTAIIASYHWEIYRHEHDTEVAFAGKAISVLLVGPKDNDVIEAIKDQTGARISIWTRTDTDDLVWPTDRVVEAVNSAKSDQLLILLESTGLKVIPVAHK